MSNITSRRSLSSWWVIVMMILALSQVQELPVQACAPPPAPSTPDGLTAASISSSRIDLAWNNVANETGYKIERSPNGTDSWAQIGTTSQDGTSYQDKNPQTNNLAAGTQYFYRVRAYNSGGDSGYSSVANDYTRPVALAALTGSVLSSTQVKLDWEAVAGETGFKIERSPNGNDSWTTISTQNVVDLGTYTDGPVTAGSTYYYQVHPFNTGGNATHSNTVGPLVILATPTGLAATPVSATQMNLAWNDISGETGYKLEHSLSGGDPWTQITTTTLTSYSNTALATGTRHYYRVRAYNSAGHSSYSLGADNWTPPLPLTNVSATAPSSTQITLSWTDATGETGYKVRRSPNGTDTWTTLTSSLAAGSTGYANTGLTPATKYYYQVIPFNSGSSAANSNTANATTTLDAPGNLRVDSVATNNLVLHWDDVNNETGYIIDRSLNDQAHWGQLNSVGANVTSYSNSSGLSAGIHVYYRLRAKNETSGLIVSPYSNVADNWTRPAALAALTATAASDTQVQLNWETVSGVTGAVRGFKVERSLTGAADSWTTVTTLTDAAVTSHTEGGLTSNTRYYFQVHPYNDGGNANHSNTVNATALPMAPTGLSVAAASCTQLSISWNSVSGVTGYKLECSPDNTPNSWTQITTTTLGVTTFANSGLTNGTQYFYRVRANNGSVNSAYSTTVSGTTLSAAPIISSVAQGTPPPFLKLAITWASVPSATSYKIYCATGETTGTYLFKGTTAGLSFDDATSLTTDTHYFYKLVAVNAGGDSAYSAAVSGWTPPAAPSNLVVTNKASRQISLAWTDHATTTTGFKVERATSGTTFTQITTTTLTTLTDTGLNPATGYNYRVRVYNAHGNSDYSNTASDVTMTSSPTSLTQALNAGESLAWLTSGDSEWFGQTIMTHDGISAAQSGHVNDEETVMLQAQVTGPGRISFSWRVSSEEDYDWLSFSIDEAEPMDQISGEVLWQQRDFQVTTGPHTLKWTYAKDENVAEGSDCGWIDEVGWTPGNPDPTPTPTPGPTPTPTSQGTVLLDLQDGSGQSVASFDTSGNLLLKGELSPNYLGQLAETSGQQEWSIKNSEAPPKVVALLQLSGDHPGDLKIKGSLYQQVPPTTGTLFMLTDQTGEPAAGIDEAGNLYLAGNLLTLGPSRLSGTSLSATQINLAWQDQTGSSSISYVLERSFSKTHGYSPMFTTAPGVKSYADSSLTAGTLYFYRVCAYDSETGSYSRYSNIAEIWTRPAALTDVSAASISNSQIDVSWSDVSGENGYKVQRSPNGTDSWTTITATPLPANTIHYADTTGLNPGTCYYYHVYPCNSGGDSADSNTASNWTRPAALTDVSASPTSSTQITLSWTDVSGEIGYKIKRSPNGTDSWTTLTSSLATGSNSHPDPGLTPGTPYYYLVLPFNSGGNAADSNPTSATTPLDMPISLTAIPHSCRQINLAWHDVVGDSGYQVESSPTGDDPWTSAGTTLADMTTFSHTDLTTGTQYFYRVRATNSVANSPYSAPVCAMTLPEAPRISSVELLSSNSLEVNWDPVSSAVKYRIHRSLVFDRAYDAQTTVTAPTETWTDTGLAAGTQYFYKIVAINAGGDSDYSACGSKWTPPVALTGLVGLAVSSTAAQLNWEPVTGESGFKIEHAASSSGPWSTLTMLTQADVTSYTQTGLTPGSVCYFQVLPFNDSGDAGPYNTVMVILPPPAPQISQIDSLSSSSLKIQWETVDVASGYKLYRSDEGSTGTFTLQQDNLTTTSYVDESLLVGHQYFYQAKATNAGGTSLASAAAGNWTRPAPVLDLHVSSLTVTQVDLAWTSQTVGITGFFVQRSPDGNDPWTTVTTTSLPASATSYSDRGVSASNTYFYHVYPFNPGGPAADSNTVRVQTSPDAPNLLAVDSVSSSSLAISWTSVAEASSYKVYRALSPDGEQAGAYQSITEVTTGTSFTDTALLAGGRYFYKVTAVDQGRESVLSGSKDNFTRPGRPSVYVGLCTNTTIDLFWWCATGAQTTYQVYRGTEVAITTSSVLYTDQGLSAGTQHAYHVVAVNPGGESAPSAEVTGSTLPMAALNLISSPNTDITLATLSSNESLHFNVSPSTVTRSYLTGTTITLTAQPDQYGNLFFSHWLVDNVQIITTDTLCLSMNEDHALQAVYQGAQLLSVSPANEAAGVETTTTQVVFNQLMDQPTTTTLPNHFSIFGAQSGKLDIIRRQVSILDMAVGLTTPSYKPGEQISVTFKSTPINIDGSGTYSRAYVWKFIAKAGAADDPTSYGVELNLNSAAEPVTSVAAGDFNLDGCLDVALGCYGQPSKIVMRKTEDNVHFTSETLTFAELRSINSEDSFTSITALATGYLTDWQARSDRKSLDFALGSTGGQNCVFVSSPYNSTGNLIYELRGPYYFGPQNSATKALAVGDVNGDGTNEIVVGNEQQQNYVYVDHPTALMPSPTFTEARPFGGSQSKTTALALADMNKDGMLDIIAGYDGVSNKIYLNDGAGHFTDDLSTTGTIVLDTQAYHTSAIAIGDFDANGYPDIAVGNRGGENCVYFNLDGLHFTSYRLGDQNGNPLVSCTTSLAAGDFNGDGRLDLAVGNGDGQSSTIYLNEYTPDMNISDLQGRMVFRPATSLGPDGSTPGDVSALAVGDFDNDGDLDLVAGSQTQPSRIYLRERAAQAAIPDSPFPKRANGFVGYVYDWAFETTALETEPLLPVDGSSWDNSPKAATDGHGHWVTVWSSENPLNYISHSGPGVGDANPPLDNFALGGQNIVISRYWDGRPTPENNHTPANDVWADIEMDTDTLWTQPVPISNTTVGYNKVPDVATDTHGNWGVVWAVCNEWGYLGGNGPVWRPAQGLRFALSQNDATTWSTQIDFPLTGFTEMGNPKIVSDKQFPVSHWMITFPGKGPADTLSEIYVTTSTTTYNNQSWTWSEWSAPKKISNQDSNLTGNNGRFKLSDESYGTISYPYGSFKHTGLDLAADGTGNWIAIWQIQKVSGTPDILFSYSQDNGATWTNPAYINHHTANDTKWDLFPVIAANGVGKWMVAWQKHKQPPSVLDNIGDSIYPSDSDIYYATAQTLAIENDYSTTTSTWSQNPWTTETLLNSRDPELFPSQMAGAPAYQNPYLGADVEPAIATSGTGDWVISWVKILQSFTAPPENSNIPEGDESFYVPGKEIVRYVTSHDDGATWDDSAKNIIYSPDSPIEKRQVAPSIAADSSSNYIVTWTAWDQDYSTHTLVPSLGDPDIIAVRSAGLLSPDHKPFPLPTPMPTATPTPTPVCVDYDTTSSPSLAPGYTAGTQSFPPADDAEPTTYTIGSEYANNPLAFFDEDLPLTNTCTFVTYFHSPVLPGGASGISAVRDIAEIDLAFEGALKNLSNAPVNGEYSVWVFRGGDYTAKDWANPKAWERLGSRNNWPKTHAGTTTGTVSLLTNFIDYVTTTTDSLATDGLFGGAGGNARPSGTLTWAVRCRNVSGVDASLKFSYANAYVHRRFWAAPAQSSSVQPIQTLALKPNETTFYTRIEGRQVTPSSSPWPFMGTGRLDLLTTNTTGISNTLRYRFELVNALPRMELRLKGYAVRGSGANTTILHTIVLPDDLTGCKQNGVYVFEGGWDYDDLGDATMRSQFEMALLRDQVFIELHWTDRHQNDLYGARGQVERDSDDDGLTDYEEQNVYHTDRFDRDSDDDGLLDGEEVLKLGLLAKTPGGSNPLAVDSDKDGLADGLEVGLTHTKLDDNLTTCIKTVSFSDSTSTEVLVLATLPPGAGDVRQASGLRLVDADPSTWTDPMNRDTDLDTFWDGPTVWQDAGDKGLILRAGEDKNGDGLYDPAGADHGMGTEDDETDPNNRLSVHQGISKLAEDADRNRLPDDFEDFADEVADAMQYYYDDDPNEVRADVIADAVEEYGDLTEGFNATVAERVSDGNGEHAQARARFRAFISWLKSIPSNRYLPIYYCGKAYNDILVGVNFLTFSDNSYGGGKTGRVSPSDDLPSPDISSSTYHGTFINGMRQDEDNATSISQALSDAYGIDFMYSWNPTAASYVPYAGDAYDLAQVFVMSYYNALPCNLFYFREKSAQSLFNEWTRIWELGKQHHIVHVAYSQGNIITAAALLHFWGHHIVGLNLIPGINSIPGAGRDRIKDKSRMHLIIMGSAYPYLLDRDVLPPDTHFAYNKNDIGFKTLGMVDLNMALVWPGQYSRIIDFPGLNPLGVSTHSHTIPDGMPNTYNWWYIYVGGPVFRLSESNKSIHADKWWLNHKATPRAPWWDQYNVFLEMDPADDDLEKVLSTYENTHYDSNLHNYVTDYDSRTYNPWDAVRRQ